MNIDLANPAHNAILCGVVAIWTLISMIGGMRIDEKEANPITGTTIVVLLLSSGLCAFWGITLITENI